MASVSERVPCCLLCNALLGAAPVFTLRDRAAFLITRYAERPREEAFDTVRKLKCLFNVAAGFELEPWLEEIEERTRRRFADQLATERAKQEAEAAAERSALAHAEENERLILEADAARAAKFAEESRRRRATQPRVKRRNLPYHPHSLAAAAGIGRLAHHFTTRHLFASGGHRKLVAWTAYLQKYRI
jgi:uncharacterized protein YhaN